MFAEGIKKNHLILLLLIHLQFLFKNKWLTYKLIEKLNRVMHCTYGEEEFFKDWDKALKN